MKKESLSIITVKTLLAVIIFTGLGTIIIGGAYLIGKQGLICSNEFTIKEKTTLDPKCSEKVEITGWCYGIWRGYEFNSETGKCVEVLMSGCSIETPFKTLEECQEVCEEVKIELVEEVSITTDKTEYEMEEVVEITIENNSDKEQKINHPSYVVERFENNGWTSIKQVWFSCGMFYEEIESITIKPKDKLEYDWNQQESWCGNSNLLWGEFSNQVQLGKYRIKGIKIGFPDPENYETIYSNEFTIKEKSALDARCSEKVKGIGPCKMGAIGYEFDSNLGKCVEKRVGGCSFEIPFGSLEECQEVCERMVWEELANGIWSSEDMTLKPRHYTHSNICYERSNEKIWELCGNEGYVDYTNTGIEVLCFGSACSPAVDILTKKCYLECPG